MFFLLAHRTYKYKVDLLPNFRGRLEVVFIAAVGRWAHKLAITPPGCSVTLVEKGNPFWVSSFFSEKAAKHRRKNGPTEQLGPCLTYKVNDLLCS